MVDTETLAMVVSSTAIKLAAASSSARDSRREAKGSLQFLIIQTDLI